MAIELRRLLDKYRVPWKERGPNCSPGNVNVSCPLGCNDPSYHLSIAEDCSAYYCFRNTKHSGRNVGFVFNKLGIPRKEYENETFATKTYKEDKVDSKKDYSQWQYFQPAYESLEAVNYLTSRLFQNAVQICERFNLKYATEGRWAGRLIIPLTVGWTGRAMRPQLQPRYLANTDESGLFTYGNSSSAIIVEGPLDAIRLASVTEQYAVIAQAGQRIAASLILRLREKKYQSIYFVPDKDVPLLQWDESVRKIRSYCSSASITRLVLPDNVKDVAEMTESNVRHWLRDSMRKSA